MAKNFNYADFVSRNSGYISAESQKKIHDALVMVAGCGMGSALAICATRLGFRRFILVDGDVVDGHNLNRQFYDHADIGRPKVDALKAQILRINPEAQVKAIHACLNEHNTGGLVAESDWIFDTIDFLDLPAILRLHRDAQRQGRPILTALNAGFGALAWFFPPDSPYPLAKALSQDLRAPHDHPQGQPAAYAEVFAAFINRLAPHFDTEVLEDVSRVLTRMKEGAPCPASQVAVGTFCVAAMAASMAVDWLSGRPVVSSPQLLIHSLRSHGTRRVDLTGGERTLDHCA